MCIYSCVKKEGVCIYSLWYGRVCVFPSCAVGMACMCMRCADCLDFISIRNGTCIYSRVAPS